MNCLSRASGPCPSFSRLRAGGFLTSSLPW